MQNIFYRRIVDMHLFAFFSTKKYACHLCIIDVYYRLYYCHYVSIFYAVKFVIVRKELKAQAQYFTVKAYIPFKLLFVSTFFDPIDFFSFIGMVS